MPNIKDAIADAKKCVKAGNPLTKCLSEANEKYHLTKDERMKVRKAVAGKND
jgi:hypothetical protein